MFKFSHPNIDYNDKIIIMDRDFQMCYFHFEHYFFGQIFLYTFYFDQYMQISSEMIDYKMFRRNMLDFLKPVSSLKIIVKSDEKILNQSLPNSMFSDTIVFLIKFMCKNGLLFNIRSKQRSIDDCWINNIYPEYEMEIEEKIFDPKTTYRQIIKMIGISELQNICLLLHFNLTSISKCFESKKKLTLFCFS